MLSTIDDIIDKNEFDNLVLTGDINTDFIRKSRHVTSVKNFIDEKGLVNAKDLFEIDFTHVYTDNDDKTHVSTIDHFLWNAELTPYV